MIKFKNPEEKIFNSEMCEIHLNLLAHAQTIELDIGSECGGYGVCGKDKVRVAKADEKKFSRPTEKELNHLSQKEINEGLRLACQCYPNVQDGEFVIEVFDVGRARKRDRSA